MTLNDNQMRLRDDRLAHLLLKEELSEVLHREADLLDDHRFDEWLALLDEDLSYTMPLRLNVHHDDLARAATRSGETCWFDETKSTLRMRVEQIQTGEHWAEEPASRVSHLVSNIRLLSVDGDEQAVPTSVDVGCRFLVYRNRVASETDMWVGRRTDTWRATPGGWQLLRRHLLLDQSVLLAKNLTVFF